jgi:hypothetical protein
VEDEDGDELNTEVTATLSTLDLFVNYYPDPRSGLQLQALIGFAAASIINDDTDDSIYQDDNGDDVTLTGPAVGAGIGYDGWVGDQWSIGVMGRLLYAPVSADLGSDVSVTLNFIVPSISFIATLH